MQLPQFSLRTLLLTMVCVAVACVGWIGWMNTPGAGWGSRALGMPIRYVIMDVPLWLPFAFAAYAIGRRSVTITAVIVFAALEGISVGVTYFMLQG